MVRPDFFDNLSKAAYGAYAMEMDRTIVFWNRSAERITGHAAGQVVGRQCYEALYGIPRQPVALSCTSGCFTVALTEAERVAPVAHVRDALRIRQANPGCRDNADHPRGRHWSSRALAPVSRAGW